MSKARKRPRDTNQPAKLVVDIAIGETHDGVESGDKDPIAILGRSGGLMGGHARADKLSSETLGGDYETSGCRTVAQG